MLSRRKFLLLILTFFLQLDLTIPSQSAIAQEMSSGVAPHHSAYCMSISDAPYVLQYGPPNCQSVSSHSRLFRESGIERPSTTRPWTSAGGPYGGDVYGLAIDPADPMTMYAGCIWGGGLFKSTDGGNSWQARTEGIICDMIFQIDIHPENSDIVFAAAAQWWSGNLGDVYRSLDGGQTWEPAGLEGIGQFDGVHVVREAGQRVIASGGSGIYLSTDGGATWSYRDGTSDAWFIFADPSNPSTIFAGGWNGHGFVSYDASDTWEDFGSNLPGDNVIGVAVDPTNSSTIYCAVWSILWDGTQGIYKSTDGGASWSKRLTKNMRNIAIDPHDSSIVWASGESMWGVSPDVWKSTDAGATWNQIDVPVEHYLALWTNVLAIDPSDGNNVFLGCYRAGILRTTDGGSTWEEANNHLSSVLMNCIAVHPNEPMVVYAGTWQADLWKTTDGGQSWFWSANGIQDGNHSVWDIAIDPYDPQTLFMGDSNKGVYKSTDGGGNWDLVLGTGYYMEGRAVEISPHNPEQIWAGICDAGIGYYGGLRKSTDGGNTWSNALPSYDIQSVKVSPSNPNFICVGTSSDNSSDQAKILISTNGGTSWSVRYVDDPGGAITSISFSTGASVVYATSESNNVIRSADGGFTWIDNFGAFDPGGRIWTVVADPAKPLTVYAAVLDNRGFYVSFNGGLTWFAYSEGLWNKSLVPLVVNQLGNWRIFYTGTSGTGVHYDFVRMP